MGVTVTRERLNFDTCHNIFNYAFLKPELQGLSVVYTLDPGLS